ncbi:MAG TPA: alpha/beta hydrolase [Candidatus Nitrosocosmicus sp.]|nr:alpha/beta hydrolase [Candidatus Nitrosocosmicus sp.]
MRNSEFSFKLSIIIIVTSFVGSLLINTNFETNLTFASISFDQSLQQSQDEIHSTKNNNQVQQTTSKTISAIGGNNSTFTQTKDIPTQNSASLSPSQQKIPMIDNISSQKVRVGDIDIAYKQIGHGTPLLLISGSGNVMDVWPTHFLQELSKDHKVIIFDNRGVGNTTSGIKPFSIKQFANDTAGFLSALKLQQADVLGFSMGSFVAQQFALTYPDKVNRLILYGASCGGQESTPQSPQVVIALSNFVNNHTEDETSFLEVTFPIKWIRENPNFLDTIPKTSEIILSTTLKKQFEINENWLSTNWTGVCDQLQKMTKPTLIITGTKDQAVPAANSLLLADKIPGAWLVQIKDAGHGLMYQYPEIFTRVVETFLNVTN